MTVLRSSRSDISTDSIVYLPKSLDKKDPSSVNLLSSNIPQFQDFPWLKAEISAACGCHQLVTRTMWQTQHSLWFGSIIICMSCLNLNWGSLAMFPSSRPMLTLNVPIARCGLWPTPRLHFDLQDITGVEWWSGGGPLAPVVGWMVYCFTVWYTCQFLLLVVNGDHESNYFVYQTFAQEV